ncbi:MobV family relaxase [Bacteroides acidifaciens]|uniref:MobV family relaxase n=1 Tax=Bacteroides acidifaciens TaxID=85831 RepID=UPI00259431CF|nr:MobV family relaxase [Bacteroides acidifaciens]
MTTQYAVCHLERGAGNDSRMSCHIERKTADGKPHIPNNADESRTHLNRELITFPGGVQNRTQAIQRRIETAGLKRKVGKNQTRAVRVLLTGTYEQMIALANAGHLDDWCRANIKWLHDTFGKDNIVSCVLHIDEKTPHLHATVVPIVTAPRTRRKREGEQKYKEKTPSPRLCANELMTRGKLRQYQDTYAKEMAGFGLKRGVVASGVRHQSQQQYNRQQALELQSDIERLNSEIEKLAAEKEKVKKEAKDGKNRILSWLGTGELPKLEKEVADKDRQIDGLQKQLADMQKRYDSLKANSLREHNSYQKEIEAATKRAVEWEAHYNAEHNRAKGLHRLAYPERNRLSSGAELVSGWIPNHMYPSLSITTLFHGNEFKNTSYNLPQNLLDRYDSGAITLHELVNELFEPWEQVDESQHSLLAVALQTAAGGISTQHIGTGSGSSSSDLPWNDKDKNKYQRPKPKGKR